VDLADRNISQQDESTHGNDTVGQFDPATAAVTPRQLDVLKALEKLLRKKGFAPTYMQLAAQVGISSIATIAKHIERLRQKQLVTGGYGHRTLAFTPRGAAFMASRKRKAVQG
jgi:Mn-dependent DtxR family transcriptional regulator